MHSPTKFLSVFATLTAFAVSQQCYDLGGKPLDDTFAPCNPGAKQSGCCATKRSSGADICLDNGLCMATRGEFSGMIWQNGCTDRTGKDEACPNICPSIEANAGNPDAITSWNVQQCDYGVYCCRANNDRASCCNNDTAPSITVSSIGAFQISTATSTSTSSISQPTRVVATAVATSSPFDTTATPIANDCKKEKHQTAVVGGAIGGVLGTVIVGLVGAMFWLYRREKHQRRLKEHYEEQISQSAAYRRNIASTVSLMASEELEELHSKSSET